MSIEVEKEIKTTSAIGKELKTEVTYCITKRANEGTYMDAMFIREEAELEQLFDQLKAILKK